MKKIILLVTLLISQIFQISHSATPTDKTLSVGWELWYPYQYRNKQQELLGLDLDIINAVAKKAGLTVSYSEMPWRRLLNFIKTGEMDIAMGASYTKDRAKTADFSLPYRLEVIRLYMKKGKLAQLQISTLTDLIGSDYMIGVEGGYYYGEVFANLMKQAEFKSHIREAVDIEGNVLMLVKGQIDGFFVDPITMKAFAEKYAMLEEFERHPVAVYSNQIHFLLSKKSVPAVTLAKFNRALADIKDNGTLAEIYQRWSIAQNTLSIQ